MNYLVHQGKVYGPQGLVNVPPESAIAYNEAADQFTLQLAKTCPGHLVAYWLGEEVKGSKGQAVTWIGSTLGHGAVTGRWRIPGGVVSGWMISVNVTIHGTAYIGRGSGSGMLLHLRKSNKR